MDEYEDRWRKKVEEGGGGIGGGGSRKGKDGVQAPVPFLANSWLKSFEGWNENQPNSAFFLIVQSVFLSHTCITRDTNDSVVKTLQTSPESKMERKTSAQLAKMDVLYSISEWSKLCSEK